MERRVNRIYDDLEANVVDITMRRDLMWLVDMCFHSVLAFEFQGDIVRKGVVEAIVLGDTRTGKTHTVEKLIKHYQHGDLITGESVSLAGLLGGVDEGGNMRGRFIRWGRLPMSHRRFVCIDEANEMSHDLIGKMSGVRSSGVYTIEKIASMKIPCLVRMIWIANTRSQKALSEYSFGVEALNEVIGKPEDIARFDICIMLGQDDVDKEALYQKKSEKKRVSHVYTSDICSALIKWVWSRKSDQVIIPEQTEERILDWSRRLSDEFDKEIPLVIETEQRKKVARISVATAARVFSHDGTRERILVLPDHVDAACNSLLRMYRSKTMGYDAWTRSKKSGDLGDSIETVIKAIGKKGMTALLNLDSVREKDLKDILGTKPEGEKAWQILFLNNGIERKNRQVRLTAAMIQRLKEARRSDEYQDDPNPRSMSLREEGETFDWRDSGIYTYE